MKTLFNDNWQFSKCYPNTTYKDLLSTKISWQHIDVPHDWLIFSTNNLYEDSTGFYKKEFYLSHISGKRLYLRFDGVYMDTSIFINGKAVGDWKYGYTTFEFDITGFIKEGINTVLVMSKYLSPNTRWYSGAGIFRNVWLVEKPEAHLVSDGTYVRTARQGDDWALHVDTEVLYEPLSIEMTDAVSAELHHTLFDRDSLAVCRFSDSLSMNPVFFKIPYDSNNIDVPVEKSEQTCTVVSPRLWDIQTPYLYTLRTDLSIDGSIVDSIEQRIGFRDTRFDSDKGFFLNDRYVKLHGACMHHDHGALGSVFNRAAQIRQFESLKRMGVNSIRTSHNPPAPEYMELADEMGLLIISEIFDMWEESKTENDYARFFLKWHQRDVASWVRRDRNHPSLIMWSIGNEIHDTHTPRGLEITKMLKELVLTHDPFRNGAVTIASNYIAWENAQLCSDELDISGYNYAEHLYEEHHEKYPHWKIYGSETASTLQSRGIYHFPASNRLLTHDDLQCSSLDNCTTNWGAKTVERVIIDDRDAAFCLGQYIWTGWDYIGEPTPYTTKNSYFGQVDTAGFEKDSYYIFQSAWTDYKTAPIVHITPYWDFNPGQLIDIRVYSNAPKFELFLNGESLGAFIIDHCKGQQLSGRYQIPYKPGSLKAVAYDEHDDVIAEHVRSSFGDATRLVLSPEKESIAADGRDLLYIEISAEDEQGNPVENARNRVSVSVTGAGRLIGLDNGDSTDYDAYKGTSRRLFSGKLVAIIASELNPGEIVCEVTSPGLPPESCVLNAVSSGQHPGITAVLQNSNIPTAAPIDDEICVRKIELTSDGPLLFSPANRTVTVHAKVFPPNADYDELNWKAVLLTEVECHFIEIEQRGTTALLTAKGDGEFRLRCSCSNGRPQPEVISELECRADGLGSAVLDPYHLIPGSQYSETNGKGVKLSFLGGVFIPNKDIWLKYEKVDFGEFGTDEVTIPIFSFLTVTPIELWDGKPGEGELVLKADYKAESKYNTYQPKTFRMTKRLKGIKTLYFMSGCEDRISVEGLKFTKLDKAFSKIYAVEHSRISGDSFFISDEGVMGIGNNVSIEFDHMNFGKRGFSKLIVNGRSHTKINSINIRFQNATSDIVRILEFPFSKKYQELEFKLEPVYGEYTVTFMFMPGSNFDLKWFQFQ